jgi:hypothetical protein
MSIVGAIRSIRVILAESAPIASVRNAWRTFKSGFGNIPSQPLASRNVQAAPKPGGNKALSGANPALPAKPTLAVVKEVTDFLHYVTGRVRHDQPQNDDQFTAGAHLFLNQEYTKQELGDVLTKAQWLKKNADWLKFDGHHALVLEVMHEQYQRLQALGAPGVENSEALRAAQALIPEWLAKANKPEQVEGLIRTLAICVEEKLPPDEQKNDSRFELGVKRELIRLGLDRAALAKFVDKAGGISFDPHGAIVLKVMGDLARTPPSEWFATRK